VLEELQDRYRYILIDEYQDTNHAQYVIAHALALKHRNICVVGDPDQSIYAWRGADIRNILDFEQDYPDAKVVRLEQNYRSTKTVLEIASALIAHNTQRKEKSLWTENEQGDPATLYLAQDEHDEAAAITRDLREINEREGIPWSGMAVFYRMNSLSRVMEDALRKANVPYQIARGVEFYNRKEIKDVLAYLRVVANPSDSVSLERIVNVPPRGLGDTSLKQIQVYATAHGMSLWDALASAQHVQGLSSRAVGAARQFVSLVERWRKLAAGEIASNDLHAKDKGPVQTVMEDVVSASGLERVLRKSDDPDLPELANVNELINAASEYDHENPEGSLQDYLALVSLVSDADHMKGAGGAVTLMTLHAAKGLEFPVVAIIGLEEGVLPHSRARANMDELEEERRLCFVGITRAQKRLILSKAARRMLRGVYERTVTSPFLTEMPGDSLRVIDRTTLDTLGDRDDEADYYRDEAQQLARRYKRGQLVRHAMHGVGKIIEITASGQQTRAVIDFQRAGRKTLILQYAQLEPVG
jgi:DNA helicase II / ATP-dependent DNA helicase PcrA